MCFLWTRKHLFLFCFHHLNLLFFNFFALCLCNFHRHPQKYAAEMKTHYKSKHEMDMNHSGLKHIERGTCLLRYALAYMWFGTVAVT